MTTYELIQEIEKELEKLEAKYNDIHRQAKRLKQGKIQPLQRKRNELLQQWNKEPKTK